MGFDIDGITSTDVGLSTFFRIADDALIIPLIAFKIRVDGNILSVYTGIPNGGPVVPVIVLVPVDDQIPIGVVVTMEISFIQVPRVGLTIWFVSVSVFVAAS